ncbi:hypothetical protein, partial [Salmonella enterica]|uniref:hypothetical protein n=1 Tax=Salmonella enterica TaxID=28901 RepID=UPI001C0F29FF
NEHHRDPGTRHPVENTRRHPNPPFHSLAGEAKHRHVAKVGETFHRQIIIVSGAAAQRAGRPRNTGIFNQTGVLELRDRRYGPRVNDIGAELRVFDHFLGGHRFPHERGPYIARDARIHAFHSRHHLQTT